MIKIAVVGSRDFDDYDLLSRKLDQCRKSGPFVLVSGGARGADTLAEIYAGEHGLQTIIFPAEWDKFGKSAGYKRNIRIVEACDLVIAFWLGGSKGTKHTIDIARKMGKRVHVVKCPGDG